MCLVKRAVPQWRLPSHSYTGVVHCWLPLGASLLLFKESFNFLPLRVILSACGHNSLFAFRHLKVYDEHYSVCASVIRSIRSSASNTVY